MSQARYDEELSTVSDQSSVFGGIYEQDYPSERIDTTSSTRPSPSSWLSYLSPFGAQAPMTAEHHAIRTVSGFIGLIAAKSAIDNLASSLRGAQDLYENWTEKSVIGKMATAVSTLSGAAHCAKNTTAAYYASRAMGASTLAELPATLGLDSVVYTLHMMGSKAMEGFQNGLKEHRKNFSIDM